MKEPIIERLEEKARQMTMRPAPAAHGGMSELWLALPFSILAFSAGAALARLIPALRWESLPILGVGIATAAFFFLIDPSAKCLFDHPAARALKTGGQLVDLLRRGLLLKSALRLVQAGARGCQIVAGRLLS